MSKKLCQTGYKEEEEPVGMVDWLRGFPADQLSMSYLKYLHQFGRGHNGRLVGRPPLTSLRQTEAGRG